MATALGVIFPLFFLGNPSGHDFEFHVNSWMEVLGQWRQGIVYPRWAGLANHGYGEARFIFYPPASWVLGAALGGLLPWKMVPGAYLWLALTLSGCSMFLLARRWLERRDAIFAAALYAANPYYIVIVYWRSAFAELLAGALLPLLLLCVLRLEEEEKKAVVPLGLTVAAAWLTNLPAAVMVNYSLALLIVMVSVLRRSPRLLLQGALAVLLGAGLAAFFLFPAAYEQKWIAIGQVFGPGVRPQDNFLFTSIDDPDHNRFNLLVSLIASAEIVVLAIAASRSRRCGRPQRQAWWRLTIWASAAVLLMFSFTSLLWKYLPELRFTQIPWRWLLCLNVAFALLVTMAWQRWRGRIVVCLAMLAVLAFVWHRVQPPWRDNATAIATMFNNQQSGAGYEGADEYVPAGGDAYEVKQDAPRVAVEAGSAAKIEMQRWDTESKLFTVDMTQPATLVLRLFYYPAWRVEVNGRIVDAEAQDDTGQMMISVLPGKSRVQLTFKRTWDRTVGAGISGATFGLLIVVVLFQQRRQRLLAA